MQLRVTLKFLKAELSDQPAVRLRGNAQVFLIDDPLFNVNNLRETILCICVPCETEVDLAFDLLAPVRRVIFDHADMAYQISPSQTLSLRLPALTRSKDTVAAMHTIIPFDGVLLRVEQADPLRRAGPYANGEFPHRAHRAAVTTEFALLAGIRELGLDKTAGQGGCGPILLMGFDTNAPHGHFDAPPHMHMHMAGPAFGTPIGHYYFDETCRIAYNLLGYRGSSIPEQRIGPQQPCLYCAPDGSLFYTLTITATGGLLLACPDGRTARIEPVSGGFDRGATMCAGECETRIETKSNAALGLLHVCIGDQETIYESDPDTGVYLRWRLVETHLRAHG